jgi:putative transposase
MRRAMVDENNTMSISRQCQLLNVSRTAYYYRPEISKANLERMRQIDELFTEDPSRGTRRISESLKRRGVNIGRGKVRRLMDRMGLSAIYCKPNLSKHAPMHKKYPYLLRGVKIIRVNQVWSTDITYIRLRNGFVYLTAVIDWYSRYVLSWRLSTTLDAAFCVEALEEALGKYGKPEIFNTDQGSQFTSDEFTGVLQKHGIVISMDGKGRALDNVFVERLWRTVKYENVFLNDYGSVAECQKGLKKFFDRYNNRREHQSLDYKFPAEVYLPTGAAIRKAA